MPSKKKIRKVKWGRVILTAILAFMVIGFGIGAGIVFSALSSMPTWNPENLTGDITTTFLDDQDNVIAQRHGIENRMPVEYEKIPTNLKNAFLSTEDPDFMKHHGVSIKALARAVYANIVHGYGAQGGSTITQQLAKNSFIDPEERYNKSLQRKIQEAILAIQIERTYTKEEIFEHYLNQIPFGSGAYSVQAAAKTFFNKDVSELNLSECALIAGLTQRPSAYNPFKNPDAAKGRRSKVLSNMVKHGYISTSESQQANSEELVLAEKTDRPTANKKYGYYIDAAIDEVEEILEEKDIPSVSIYKGGYKIYTTMNVTVQDKIEEVYSDPANFPQDMNSEKVQSAMALIENSTGKVVGLMGGREYTAQRGLNRATQMLRSPGSSIKPVVDFAPALEKGFSPASVVDDSPVTFAGNYSPKNLDGRFRGLVTLREAVKDSINIPAVKLLDTVGVKTGFDYGVKMGLPLTATDRNLSLALGGLTRGVSPLNMASAYTTFANSGIRVEPFIIKKIEDHKGNIIYEAKIKETEVLSAQSAYLMTDMLKTAVQSGTGYRARMNRPVAGKTGTTQLPDIPSLRGKKGNQDAWFVGYTPELCAAVWIGFDKTDVNHYLYKSYGGQYPAQIWKKVMEAALKDVPVTQFKMPSGISYVKIDRKSGLLANEFTPAEYIITELFASQNIPKGVSNSWTEAQVCADTGLLASPNCPNVISKSFLRRPPSGSVEDGSLQIPTEICTLHGSPTDQEPNPNGGDPNNNSQETISRPNAPVLAGEKRNNSVQLAWQSNSSGEVVYNIERWTSKNSKKVTLGITQKNNFVDNSISPNETYYYQVNAINPETNESSASNTITIK